MLLSKPSAAFGFSLGSQSVCFLSGRQRRIVDSCLIPLVAISSNCYSVKCIYFFSVYFRFVWNISKQMFNADKLKGIELIHSSGKQGRF